MHWDGKSWLTEKKAYGLLSSGVCHQVSAWKRWRPVFEVVDSCMRSLPFSSITDSHYWKSFAHWLDLLCNNHPSQEMYVFEEKDIENTLHMQ